MNCGVGCRHGSGVGWWLQLLLDPLLGNLHMPKKRREEKRSEEERKEKKRKEKKGKERKRKEKKGKERKEKDGTNETKIIYV